MSEIETVVLPHQIDYVALFTKMVREHDLTYQYSDDPNSYRRGSEEKSKIRSLATKIGHDKAKEIWDANVDRCLSEGFRESFYWRITSL